MKYFIRTFGCQQNEADSERIESGFLSIGMKPAKNYQDANYVVINTCMVRKSAEDRIYGLINNLKKIKNVKKKNKQIFKIIMTGCMVGTAVRDKTGKYLKKIKEIMPDVDKFVSMEKMNINDMFLKRKTKNIFIPISNGCNNFCSFCIVPFARGREKSRPYQEIIDECKKIKSKKNRKIVLLGQNVNSYGADLISKGKKEFNIKGKKIKPVYVKHLGKHRIPTLFPYLLEEIAKMGFKEVDFISSNPWDFSDELIETIKNNKNITRTLHLPVQSGDSNVLKRMNRWYTAKEYCDLINKIKKEIPRIKFTTDIIVGFCGETEKEFKNTVKLAKKIGFEKAYVARYTSRPFTYATKNFKNDVPLEIKKKRWLILEKLINRPKLKKKNLLK